MESEQNVLEPLTFRETVLTFVVGGVMFFLVGMTFVEAAASLVVTTVAYQVLVFVESAVRDQGFLEDRRAQSSPRATATAAAGIVSSGGLVYLVKNYGIGGVLYQIFMSIIGMIQGAGETFMAPLEAFGSGLARVVAGVFPARILNEAADFTAFSITQGDWAFFGPFTFAVGVAATVIGIYVFMVFLRRTDLSAFGALFSRRP